MSNQIMKGIKMKEKIILSMSILCLLGIIWISKANQKNDTDLTIMNQVQPSSIENFTPEHVDDLKSLLVLSAAEAGEYYKLRIPIAAESSSGLTDRSV